MKLPMDPEFQACHECWEPLEVGTMTCPNCLAKDPHRRSRNILLERGVFVVGLTFVILWALFY